MGNINVCLEEPLEELLVNYDKKYREDIIFPAEKCIFFEKTFLEDFKADSVQNMSKMPHDNVQRYFGS